LSILKLLQEEPLGIINVTLLSPNQQCQYDKRSSFLDLLASEGRNVTPFMPAVQPKYSKTPNVMH